MERLLNKHFNKEKTLFYLQIDQKCKTLLEREFEFQLTPYLFTLCQGRALQS